MPGRLRLQRIGIRHALGRPAQGRPCFRRLGRTDDHHEQLIRPDQRDRRPRGHHRTRQAVPEAMGLGRDSQGQPEARLSLPMARATGMLTPVIDPDSAVPPYEQVAKTLRDEIVQGTMTGRIPSVHTIAEHHHVSHRVAARALEILQGEGMIENVPGEGHVVRHPRA
jgi:Bacterial regulatory proteins, gntR family